MFGDYLLLLAIGAGMLFIAVLGFASFEEAAAERRRQRAGTHTAPATMPPADSRSEAEPAKTSAHA